MDTNLFIAKDVNPDQFAKAKTIADEMGLSPQFVNNSLPEFEKKQNELKVQNDLNALTYSAPVTKEFVSNPDNLILSQDSLKELSEIEKTISKRTENQYYNTFVSNIYGMAANVAQLPGVFGYIQRENQKFANKVSKDINLAPTELVPDVEVTVSEQDAKEQFQYFKNNSFVNNLRENQNYFAAKAPDAQMSVIEEAKNGNFLNAGRALSLQVVGNAPNLIANIAAYWAGGPVAGSMTAFVPTFSQGATEAIEKGKPEAALTSGAVQGAAEVLFENLGSFRLLKQTEQQLVKTIGKEGAKEVVYNGLKQLVNNSFQEGTEEFATSIAQDLTKYVVEDDKDALKGIMTRAVDSFLVGAGSGVGISAAGNISGLVKYNQKIKQAESDAELYSALAGKTKLSERSTEAQKQFIAKQTEGGPIENTYISREGFKEYAQKQNKSETEIAQEMGILEEFNKSVETETDIEVSTSKMATDVAKSIHHAELKNDIKFNPENLTVNEAKKAQDETKTQVQEQFDAAMAAMPEETQIKYKESAKEVYKLISQDLRNTDKMSAQELSANAQIWENTFLTYGVLTNTDPLELFKKYGVNIRAIDQSVDFDMDLNKPAYDEMMTEASIQNGEIINVDDFALDRLKKRINESQAGFRTAKINDNNEMVGTISGQSTFPEFFKDKGLTRDSVLNIIDKYKNKKKLTDNQKETLVDLYNSLIDSENRREYYQSVPTLNQKSLIENSKKLQEQGFKFDVSETPVFDENDNEISIDVGQPGYQFTVFAEDNTGNEIGRASFIVDKKGQLMANDEDGMIEAVTVDASFRRQGIASELYRLAAEHVGKPIVDVNEKTDQGKAFRQALRELNPKTFFQSSNEQYIGFDLKTDYYHGTNTIFDKENSIIIPSKSGAAGPGFYLASKKSSARASGENVYKFRVRSQNVLDLTKEAPILKVAKELNIFDEVNAEKIFNTSPYSILLKHYSRKNNLIDLTGNERQQILSNEIEKLGYDMIKYDYNGNDAFVVFNPDNVKLSNAKFEKLGNILNQDKKASFQILGNKQFNINLFETSDESSFMHESAHYFLEVMKDLATEQNARPEMVELFNDVLKTLNVESADQVGEKEQEIFARSFEAYLMKGEAPSKGLRKAFAQFKTFLINIYINLTGLEKQAEPYGINVSDQMKSVFDRMLVAGEEIIDAEKNGPQPLFTDAVLSGLNAEKAQKYIDAMEQAREFAEDELRAKLMKDVIKKKDKAFNEKYNELVQKGTELANSLTEFKAMQTIRENEQLKISKPYVEKYFPELAKYIPNDLMVQDGGVNPDVIAEMFGYPSGYAMLEAMKPYRKGIEAFAETYAATKIKEQFPELLEQPELSDEAIKAAHNENYRLVKRLELEFLQEQFPQIVKETAGRLIRRMPKTQAVIQQADNIIAQTNVSQIKPHLFLNAEKKHAAEAAKQFKKGEFELAFEAKRKEYLNFELYRSAIKAKEDVNKSVKSFKRLFKSDEDMAKRYDMDLINASRAILGMYGIGKPGKLPSEYIEKIKQYDPEAYVTIEALVKSTMDGAANYESVSYDKFVEMRDTVNAIFDLAKSNKEFELEGKKVEMESIVDDLTERLKVITPADTREYYKTASEWEKHKDQLMGAIATTKRVESWALGLGGNFHKYIYQPIADATTAYRLRKIEVLKQYRNLLDTYIKNQPGLEEPIVATELKFKGKTFVFQSKSELITLLLHTGNESNKSKMLEGYGWGEKNQQGELVSPEWDSFINRMISEGKLTKNDFDFAQGVWDLFESLKPEIQKTHKELLGFYMNEITAKEFTNQFGTYRGGYAPAKTDYAEVSETFTRELVDQINSDASFVFPTTGRGATRSRVESYKAPLSRDINLVGAHIDWAMRYAYIEKPTKQIARLLKNKKFMATMNDFDKSAIANLLTPWLDRTAKQKVVEPSKDGMWRYIGNIASFLRRNVNMQIMTFNVVNSLEQFGGLAVATAKVKPKYIKSSLVNYMSNGPAMVDDIMTKSDFMRSINGENIYDIHNAINEILVKPTKAEEFQDFARKNVYVLQSATQNIVNTIVWSGAYAEAKDNGMSENEAVKLADSVVRTTQGTNLPEDISKFETGSQTEMLFKTYVSYFNMLTNLTASRINEIHRSVGLRKGAGELFYLYAAVLAVPSAISMALRMGAAGIVDEDDDDFYVDDILANFFGYQLKTVAAGVPFAGQFAVAGINRVMTKNQLDDRLSLSPAISIAETMVGVPGAVVEQIIERGELSKKNVKDALTFMGVVSSLPIGVLGKPVGYIMDVESGKARPTGPIDFTRGLVTGKPGSQ